MQASKIELGRDYATRKFDFRATAIVTIKRTDRSINYVRGVQISPPVETEHAEIEVEVKDIIDTVEERDRLNRAKAARDAAAKAAEEARVAKRRKAAELLAKAIGVQFDGARDYRVQGPKVSASYSCIEVSEDAIDALIQYLEGQR